MPYLVVHHQVEDFARWKPIFDGHAAARKAAGCRGGALYRSAQNPNDIFIFWEWDTLDHARQFTESQDLRNAMQSAGVIGRPDLHFLDKLEDVEF
jgi:hypothetical protein